MRLRTANSRRRRRLFLDQFVTVRRAEKHGGAEWKLILPLHLPPGRIQLVFFGSRRAHMFVGLRLTRRRA